MRALLIVILAALAAACSMPFGSGGDARPVLVNHTRNALVYFAIDLDDAPLFDPSPTFDPAHAPERVVAAGGELAIEVDGGSGNGVLLVIYEIPEGHHTGPVRVSRLMGVTRAELLHNQGRIVIEEQ